MNSTGNGTHIDRWPPRGSPAALARAAGLLLQRKEVTASAAKPSDIPTDQVTRTTEAVFGDHLARRKRRQVEHDTARNYAEDVVLLTGTGIYHRHQGVLDSAAELDDYLPDATFEYRTRLVAGEYAFLEWTGSSPLGRVCDGAGSFVIREDRIVTQTIHYTVKEDHD